MEGAEVMAVAIGDLPQMVYLEDFGGDYKRYIDAVYAVFERDFIKHKASFGSTRLALKFNPLFQERAYTFYHMTHHGEVESEREPDLRRCERMPWARPTIEDTVSLGLKFWEQERHGKSRVCIWLEAVWPKEDEEDEKEEAQKENYFVVLDVRTKYVLLWTAFYSEHDWETKKKQREYEAWVKQVNGKIYTPDDLIKEIQARLNARMPQ